MEKSSFPQKIDQDVINYLKEIIYGQNEKFLNLEKRLDSITSQLGQLRDDLLNQKKEEDPFDFKRSKDDFSWKAEKTDPFLFSEKVSESSLSTNVPQDFEKVEEFDFKPQEKPMELNSEKILEEFTSYHKKKSQVESSALKSYLTKLEKVIVESWGKAKLIFEEKQFLQFLDLGLTVLHGIIEYTYVTHFRKIPENTLDYYSKAKTISGVGIFKDLNLLDKMESVFSDKQSGNKPILAKTVIRGWYERLDKIFADWNFRVQNSPIY
ncbi:MAG: hypothetical protein ACW981_10405 [Candidatus Hodarchaeales archaeon]|jgi:hypothetical protein